MEIINKLNTKIDKLIYEYELLKKENENLRQDLDILKNKNDELERNNQDMLLRIDSTLTFVEAKHIGK
ncbi:cell division protein ZapB [Halarcobacter ebronensis]|uniref:Cell division protein ZapB n=1 Tax=Halarcobacter ebronensis TaxID=1462615 RepID=A0A4Q1AUX5_9BACT|nr:cell division protein ZapB [Halarcobacter ebronensis]QKF81659.1 hypothetical protein AEBR_1164 [Halarcobacter ebronensis]RXK05583.1 hypothetical protein CRV07_08730 [Halarcobacter ebronensis]